MYAISENASKARPNLNVKGGQEPEERGGFGDFRSGRTWDEGDDVPLDEDEAAEFYRWMFEEVLKNRFSRSKGKRYRSQRVGAAGGGVHTYSGWFAQVQEAQEGNWIRQMKEHEEYRQRVHELEREMAEEKAELDHKAREEALARSRSAAA
ncbi:hypothetical protein HWV62_2972 [Athelia sp. TMB]|nr:hypothetical protein HWV62_2972 [Athelia sp. TMB]